MPIEQRYKAPASADVIRRVQAPDGFIHASIDPRFGHPFGRDAMEMIEDLIEFRPEMADRALLALATLQGTNDVSATQERRGKMPHEHLQRYTHERNPDGTFKKLEDGQYSRVYNPEQTKNLDNLSVQWGVVGSTEEASKLDSLTVYFNSDTTQMFVNMVARLCQARGNKDFLDQEINGKDGKRRTIRDSVELAMEFLDSEREKSERGYIEFYEPSPKSHRNNYWKDGYDSLLHSDGTLPNYDAPIASLVVQGLTVQAYEAASYLFEEDEDRVVSYKQVARDIRENVLADFWVEEQEGGGFFAMSLDHAENGEYRQMAFASDAGAVLRTGLLDGLSEEVQRKYLEPIAKRLFSDEFWAKGAGIRSMSRDVPQCEDYIAYQRRNTVWIKEQEDIAEGLERYGLTELAEIIRTQMINTMNMTQKPVEFAVVIDDGRVVYDYDNTGKNLDITNLEVIPSASIPQGLQGWSASAMLREKYRRTRRWRGEEEIPDVSGWRKKLVMEVKSQMGDIPAPLIAKADIVKRTPESRILLDKTKGRERRKLVQDAMLYKL